MGYKVLKNINNRTKPAQRLCQFTQSPNSSHTKSPSSFNKRSSAIIKRKSSHTPTSHYFNCQLISQINVISWTIACLVIMISIDRIGVNCTMLGSRVSVNNNIEVNEWIEDDLMGGDSDNQFVDKVDDNIDMDRLQNIIIQGLNLTKIPDVSKVSPFYRSEFRFSIYL